MGVYIYKIVKSGAVKTPFGPVYRAIYAYKPWGDDDLNRKLEFRTGVLAAKAGWARTNTRPRLVAFWDEKDGYGKEGSAVRLYPESAPAGYFYDDSVEWGPTAGTLTPGPYGKPEFRCHHHLAEAHPCSKACVLLPRPEYAASV